jgi:hypothetical protein
MLTVSTATKKILHANTRIDRAEPCDKSGIDLR